MKFMMAQKKETWLVIISVLDEATFFRDLKKKLYYGHIGFLGYVIC